MAFGLGLQAIFFSGADGGVVVLEGRIHAVEEVAVGGPVGEVIFNEVREDVFVAGDIDILEEISDVLTEEREIVV